MRRKYIMLIKCEMWDMQLHIRAARISFTMPDDASHADIQDKAKGVCASKGILNVWALTARNIMKKREGNIL